MRVSCKKSRARNIREPSEVLQTDRLLGDSGPGAAWVHGRESLVVVFYGSSSCAPIPVDLTVDAPDSITAEFAQNASEVCTSDLAANTFRFDTPGGVDTDGDVELVITVTNAGGDTVTSVSILG